MLACAEIVRAPSASDSTAHAPPARACARRTARLQAAEHSPGRGPAGARAQHRSAAEALRTAGVAAADWRPPEAPPQRAQTYDQIYTGSYRFWGGTTALNYTSPLLHAATLPDLDPATRYWYRVAGDCETFSAELSFVSPQAAGVRE